MYLVYKELVPVNEKENPKGEKVDMSKQLTPQIQAQHNPCSASPHRKEGVMKTAVSYHLLPSGWQGLNWSASIS